MVLFLGKEKAMGNNGSVLPAWTAGIVTVGVPLMMPDGKEYRFIWAKEWREVPVVVPEEKRIDTKPDGEYEYATLVSGQLWGLEGAAKVAGFGKVFVPGELVRCWVRLENSPVKSDVYVLE